jgi:hypothetical protein
MPDLTAVLPETRRRARCVKIKPDEIRRSLWCHSRLLLKIREGASLASRAVPRPCPSPCIPAWPVTDLKKPEASAVKPQGGAVQLRLINDSAVRKAENEDLVGRYFCDGRVYVRVVRVNSLNTSQVIVEREIDGKSWAVSARLIRMIVRRERKKRAA